MAEVAEKRRAAREARSSAVRQIEGDPTYEVQQTFLAMTARLAREGWMSASCWRKSLHNEIVIRQNEKLMLLLAARANKRDEELLAELKKLNRRLNNESMV